MDAVDRDELDRLRRRVFGPDADDDPATIARLLQLEAVAHPGAASGEERIGPTVGEERIGPGVADEPAPWSPGDDPPTSRVAEAPLAAEPGRGRGWRITALALVALATAAVVLPYLGALLSQRADERTTVVSAREAYTIVRDPDARVLLRIPFDEEADRSLPRGSDLPRFPTSGEITWAASPATLYGWEVWIAGAAGAVQPLQCIAVRRDGQTRGRCVTAVLRGASALAVTLPYESIPPGELPDGMTERERIGFWWVGGEAGIMVLLGERMEQ